MKAFAKCAVQDGKALRETCIETSTNVPRHTLDACARLAGDASRELPKHEPTSSLTMLGVG
jgi:hypothetical protein